jgi:hypothetical protein
MRSAVTAPLLAPKPASLSQVESAAVPLLALSAWQGAPALLARSGRLVSVPAKPGEGSYFVVEPSRGQLIELAKLVDSGQLRVAIDSTRLGPS